MLLRTKLISGFMGGIALLLIVGGLNLYTMNTMDKQATQSTHIDEGTIALLMAKISQLRFLVYGDSEEAQLTRNYLAASEKNFRIALEKMKDGDQQEAILQLDGKITTYSTLFTTLTESAETIKTAEADLLVAADAIVAGFEQILSGVEAILRENISPEEFDIFKTISNARYVFFQARLEFWRFRTAPKAANAEAATKAIVNCQRDLDRIQGLLVDPNNQRTFVGIQEQVLRYKDLLVKSIDLRAKQANTIASIHQLVLDSVTLAEKTTEGAASNLRATHDDAESLAMMVSVFALIVGLGCAWFLTRSVLMQLGKDPGELAQLALRVAQGDFEIDDGTPRTGVFGSLLTMARTLRENIILIRQEGESAKAEYGKAQEAMNQTEQAQKKAEQSRTEAIREVAGQLEEILNAISTAARQLAERIENSEHGAAEQAWRMTETATSMDEMNSTVLEVAKNAGAASEASVQTREQAVQGAHVVEEAVTSIHKVQQDSLLLKKDMLTLSQHAQSIDQIMNVISDIADQTNLLALNAAIEAARAGDAGRGFAVVADEVRKLAEKTMASTADVGNAIRLIQESAAQSMHQVDSTVLNIEQATTLAQKSGEALKKIVNMIDNTADQVRAIATASEEQSSSSEAINRTIGQVDSIASETASAMKEAKTAVSELARQAHVLTGVVERMRKQQ